MINERLVERLVEHLMRQEEVRGIVWHYTTTIVEKSPETAEVMVPLLEKHINSSVASSEAFRRTLIALLTSPNDNGLFLESQEIKQIEDQQPKQPSNDEHLS